jgi:hypothetical protein
MYEVPVIRPSGYFPDSPSFRMSLPISVATLQLYGRFLGASIELLCQPPALQKTDRLLLSNADFSEFEETLPSRVERCPCEK